MGARAGGCIGVCNVGVGSALVHVIATSQGHDPRPPPDHNQPTSISATCACLPIVLVISLGDTPSINLHHLA